MHVLPMCFTVYKIFGSTLRPYQNTLAIVPYNTNDNSEGIRLRVPGPLTYQLPAPRTGETAENADAKAFIQKFENLLDLNNYEIIDMTDSRMVTWCDKDSQGGTVLTYKKKPEDLKKTNSHTVEPDQELNEFVKIHKVVSFKLGMERTKYSNGEICLEKIMEIGKTAKYSEIKGPLCDADTVLALMEAGQLRAIGKFSSVTSHKYEAIYNLDLDIPIEIEKFVDFGGFQSSNGITRLIGYQGELRMIGSNNNRAKIYDVCNKFGQLHEQDDCFLSRFRYEYLSGTKLNLHPRQPNSFNLLLGGSRSWHKFP